LRFALTDLRIRGAGKSGHCVLEQKNDVWEKVETDELVLRPLGPLGPEGCDRQNPGPQPDFACQALTVRHGSMRLFTTRVVLATRRGLPARAAGRSFSTTASSFNAEEAWEAWDASKDLWPKPLQDPDLVRELDKQRARCAAAVKLPPPHGIYTSATAPRLTEPEEQRQNVFDFWCLERGGMDALEAAFKVAPPSPGHLALVTRLLTGPDPPPSLLPLSLSHTHTLSLSLSLSHTHTHTQITERE